MSVVITSNRPTLEVGGRVFTDLSTLKTIATLNGGASGSQSNFRLMTGSSGYTPSGSTALKVKAMKITPETGSTGLVDLVYSDNDVGLSTTTAFTNPVRVCGTSNFHFVSPAFSSTQSFQNTEYPMEWTVPNAKYAGIGGPGAGVIVVAFLYGYEE